MTITAAAYATLIGKSLSTAYRWIRAGRVPAIKTGGRWMIELSTTQNRAFKRFLVDEEAKASRGCAVPFGVDITAPRARKAYCRAALEAIGAGDLILAIDHARIWRGRQDKYGYNTWRRAVAEVDRLVAA